MKIIKKMTSIQYLNQISHLCDRFKVPFVNHFFKENAYRKTIIIAYIEDKPHFYTPESFICVKSSREAFRLINKVVVSYILI